MSVLIAGGAGCGKSRQLRVRAERARAQGCDPLFFSAPAEIGRFAFDLLGAEPIDDVESALLFERAALPLLRLEWEPFVRAEVDPEVPGLRSPERFLDAAYRLIAKLRDALIDPGAFLHRARTGAAEFYGRPPNFAHPDLLYYTKEEYRDSLDVSAEELQRQFRREIDLAKIVHQLYSAYREQVVARGRLTAGDAVAAAVALLAEDSVRANSLRNRHGAAFVDDAQHLTIAQLVLLQRIFGDELAEVTFAGDAGSAIDVFRGARPERVFATATRRDDLTEQHRSPPAIDVACNHLLGSTPAAPRDAATAPPALTLFRAATPEAEASYVAHHVAQLLDSGAPASEIAVLFRSVSNVRIYADALARRSVASETIGDVNVLAQPDALDALALLWNVHDPYRHEFLLRTLSGRALALSDASVYSLCCEPPDAQAPLFADDEAAGEARARPRIDAKRDLRLGWNLLRGDQDARLLPVARERVERFRAARESWLAASTRLSLAALARLVWSDGLARAGPTGSPQAHAQSRTIARLLARIEAFEREHPDCALGDFLEYAQSRASSDFESWESDYTGSAVRLLSIEAARGATFDHVVVPQAQAGAFPRWYVPDAFVYSPSLGMIAKENVGDATASRTAKFTYYMFRSKAREAYNVQERRAFVYAMRRARRGALVTASGRATRGFAAPEFLAELQAARLPGTIDRSEIVR